jgi:hypothetical protein
MAEKHFVPTAFANDRNDGMSLRDYFAAAALIGIKSNPALLEACCQVPGMKQQEAIAFMAYVDADAMLAARDA